MCANYPNHVQYYQIYSNCMFVVSPGLPYPHSARSFDLFGAANTTKRCCFMPGPLEGAAAPTYTTFQVAGPRSNGNCPFPETIGEPTHFSTREKCCPFILPTIPLFSVIFLRLQSFFGRQKTLFSRMPFFVVVPALAFVACCTASFCPTKLSLGTTQEDPAFRYPL